MDDDIVVTVSCIEDGSYKPHSIRKRQIADAIYKCHSGLPPDVVSYRQTL